MAQSRTADTGAIGSSLVGEDPRRGLRPPLSGLVIGIALALTTVNIISIDDAAKVALISYPLMALVFGALYGCTLSLGQVLCGVVTLKHSGRRVGLWRGMTRYLAVAFFPITVVLLIWILFDAPTMDLDPIDVYYRRPPQAW